MYIGDFPETLHQAMLVGIMLVGRLGPRDADGRDGNDAGLVQVHHVVVVVVVSLRGTGT